MKKMRVALVFPRFSKFGIYKRLLEPPLGLCYLAAVLKKKKVEVQLFDGTFDDMYIIIEKMKKFDPDLIGVYVKIVMTENALLFAEKAKAVFNDVPIVFGGPMSTVVPEEILSNKNVDIVALGEGEKIITDLVENLDNLERVKGIYFKRDGKIIKNPRMEFIQDLDSIPFPDRDILHPQYFKNLEQIVVGSRGCIFSCAFCQPTLKTVFGTLRVRSPKNVVDEIELLVKKCNTKRFLFHDDTFTVKKDWAIEICKEIVRRRLEVKWICNSRVNTLDKELVKWMRLAGCDTLELGVESGSDYIRNTILKKQTATLQIEEAFKLCHEAKIKAAAYLMVGSPYETKQTLYETIQLVKKIKPEMALTSITTPMPGTYLWEVCKENNLITAKKWSDLDYSAKISIKHDNITAKDIERVRNKIKFMSLMNFVFYCLRTFRLNELFTEIIREPKRLSTAFRKFAYGAIGL